MRRLLTLGAIAVALVAAAPAAGDGGPAQGAVQGWDGIARGAYRYVAVPTPGWTSVQQIERRGGRVLRFMNVRGSWGIPLPTFDGASDALLPDGRTLLLAEPGSGPVLRKTSTFAFVDIKKVRVLRKLRLAGHFTFDAISPEARYLYLTEYVSAQNFARYRVRAYDLRAGRLLAKIVADRRSWETAMEGMPISRVNRDGWAYTLYGLTGKRPFIHALNTRRVESVCIFLPWKRDPQLLANYRLRLDGAGRLTVRGPRGRTVATVDRASFRVLSFVTEP